MKQVLIAQEYVPNYRAPFFEELVEQAARQGIHITVAANGPVGAQSQRGDATNEGFVVVFQREFSLFGRRITIRNLNSLIRNADLVILEQARRNIDIYRLLLPQRHQKIALWGHGRDRTKTVGKFDKKLLAKLTRRSCWFFGYTQSSVEDVVAQGVPRARTTLVLNSTDTGRLKRDLATVDSALQSEFRTRHGLNGRVALFLGALDESKRLDWLIAAGCEAASADDQFRLVIAGDGALRGYVRDQELTHDWLLSVGPLSGVELASWLAVADVIPIPGRVGLVAVDSIASCTPIVAVNGALHGPEFDYLKHGENCVLSENSLEAFISTFLSVLRDDDLRQKITIGCELSSNLYSTEIMARNFLDGVKNALST
ncbi:glycosyltransferase family 4 protein [Rhodococcus ruber]|uniref:Glycosyltransferase family 4 protein n=1 Tax=Rhodococcus ruber TaxID=1830 RepID=A0ABT4MAQ2_9NOCA|nr:glycosyltransferase family 4 protein [Rhodococcus ruber]MCZ4518051.1 glycosyltransferase family 4 protein [Rhodococcus ruber]